MLDSHLFLADTVGFKPMNLGKPNRTIIQALTLATPFSFRQRPRP